MTTEQALEKGGKMWTSSDGEKRRVYFSEMTLFEAMGLKITTYKTGNISSASIKGAKISNSKADQIRDTIRWGKCWVDCADGALHTEGLEKIGSALVSAIETALRA